MRICILAPENSPSAGGVGAYTYNLARSLSEQHDVHVVSIHRDIEDSLETLLAGSCTVTYAARARASDPFLYNAKFQVRLASFLGRYLRENKIEIVHSHSGHVPHLFAQYLIQIPVVSTVHATVRGLRVAIRNAPRHVFAEDMVDLLSPAILAAEKAGFSKSERLLPVSRFTLRQLAELYSPSYAAKAEVLPNAVDPNLFAPSDTPEGDEFVVVNVTRPHGIKGLEAFIRTVRALRQVNPNVSAKVVGFRQTSIGVPSIPDSHGIEFVGRVPYHKMPYLYQQSSLVVVTSSYENCPGVMLEAMACGRTVVAPRLGGIPEVIKDKETGRLYDPEDPRSLLDTVTGLIDDEETRRRIGSDARNLILREYSWRKRLSRVTEIYREILDGDHSS